MIILLLLLLLLLSFGRDKYFNKQTNCTFIFLIFCTSSSGVFNEMAGGGMPLTSRRPTDCWAGGTYKGERRIYIIRPVVVIYERVFLAHPDHGNHGNPHRAGNATARDVTVVAILIHTLNGRCARIITPTFFFLQSCFFWVQ